MVSFKPSRENVDLHPAHRLMMRIIETSGVSAPLVLHALRKIERYRFVPEVPIDEAYEDHPLPIGNGQTISQPSLVAMMTELLQLNGGERVLEIGSGCGYQTALLACIAGEVIGIEIIPGLAERARKKLESIGLSNVQIRTGDGWNGAPDKAPFAGIILSCGAPVPPPKLIAQLDEGASLVGPIGSNPGHCILQKITRRGNALQTENITAVRFVPMTGEALKQEIKTAPGEEPSSWW
ncbi:MAG: protein-L-isoaspartate(D-aspartate) O-methyltransferase [Candidatus Ozemobacteraceae bacterium]